LTTRSLRDHWSQSASCAARLAVGSPLFHVNVAGSPHLDHWSQSTSRAARLATGSPSFHVAASLAASPQVLMYPLTAHHRQNTSSSSILHNRFGVLSLYHSVLSLPFTVTVLLWSDTPHLPLFLVRSRFSFLFFPFLFPSVHVTHCIAHQYLYSVGHSTYFGRSCSLIGHSV
jgi:hypothetical protein